MTNVTRSTTQLTCKLTGFVLVDVCVCTTWFFSASSQELTSAFVPQVTTMLSIMLPRKCNKQTLSQNMTKPTKWPVHQEIGTQISMGICPVWSESSHSAWRSRRSLATHRALRVSDQTAQFAGRSESWLGTKVMLLVLSCWGSLSQTNQEVGPKVENLQRKSPAYPLAEHDFLQCHRPKTASNLKHGIEWLGDCVPNRWAKSTPRNGCCIFA